MMRVGVVGLLAVLLAAGGMLPAFAADKKDKKDKPAKQEQAQQPTAEPAATSSTTTVTPSAAAATTREGAIGSISPNATSANLIMTLPDGTRTTLTVDPQREFLQPNGNKMFLKDLKVGQNVKVGYTKSGSQDTVTSVELLPYLPVTGAAVVSSSSSN